MRILIDEKWPTGEDNVSLQELNEAMMAHLNSRYAMEQYQKMENSLDGEPLGILRRTTST